MPSYPGLGLPVNALYDSRFPNAMPDWQAAPNTALEIQMMQLINQLTEKPDWTRKVFDTTITDKWRSEAISADKSMIDETAFDYCLAELKEKAEYFKNTGLISVFDTEARVIKSDTLVSEQLQAKLKRACEALLAAQGDDPDMHPKTCVQDLIHPSLYPLVYGRSRVNDNESVDAVHAAPARSGSGIQIQGGIWDDSQKSASWWESIYGYDGFEQTLWSMQFQWLPSNFTWTDGKVKATSYINNLHPKHHPAAYNTIEQLVEAVIPAWEHCLTMFPERNPTLRSTAQKKEDVQPRFPKNDKDGTYGRRIPIQRAEVAEYPHRTRELYEKYKAQSQSEREGRNTTPPHQEQVVVRPGMVANWLGVQGNPNGTVGYPKDPMDYDPESPGVSDYSDASEFRYFVRGDYEPVLYPSAPAYPTRRLTSEYDLRKHLEQQGLQIIVKMVDMSGKGAKTNLDDGSRDYQFGFPTDPGSWHVEGQLNEHIVATALVYFDSDNLEPETLNFRQCVDQWAVEYEQFEWSSQQGVFGLEFGDGSPRVQDLGAIETKQGRLLAFPNVLQHAVSGLKLKDSTKPARRRFIALWLVDPAVRVISTANVPPQQFNWWLEEILRRKVSRSEEKNYVSLLAQASGIEAFNRLPVEVLDMIYVYAETGRTLMTKEDADEIRLKLMKERTRMTQDFEKVVDGETFNFCEH